MKRILFISLILSLYGCNPSYEIIYRTSLDTGVKSLMNFEDTKFIFDFIVAANGIYFIITNKTDTTSYIVWDKSYFILPDGNSSKALNTDILEVDKNITQKENYESIIPSKSKFSRFTTATTNVNEFTSYNTQKISLYFENFDMMYSSSSNRSFFSSGQYWSTEIKANEQSLSNEKYLEMMLNKIGENILQENSLGLGLAIKMGKDLHEYRFNFLIQEVEIYENVNGVLKLVRIARAPDFKPWEIL
ncbi:MAG: hypothetical protein V1720_04740 [bacterium]